MFIDTDRKFFKPYPREDLYIGWSTIADVPVWTGTRAELRAAGITEERLRRADATGTSVLPDQWGASFDWDHDCFVVELWAQRWTVKRSDVAGLCRLVLVDQVGRGDERVLRLLTPDGD